jgi:hypothetical protein
MNPVGGASSLPPPPPVDVPPHHGGGGHSHGAGNLKAGEVPSQNLPTQLGRGAHVEKDVPTALPIPPNVKSLKAANDPKMKKELLKDGEEKKRNHQDKEEDEEKSEEQQKPVAKQDLDMRDYGGSVLPCGISPVLPQNDGTV